MTDSLVKDEEGLLESLVGKVADDFLRHQENGEQPDIEDYVARYPQAAPVLRKVLTALHLLEQSALSTAKSAGEHLEGAPVAFLGDFRIIRQIGRGGMGIVYEAEQVSLGRRVALKVLPFAGALDARQLQRFKNEAQAAAHLQHQNIVPVYFVGCERGVHFYAMQFVEGQTLAQVIAELRQERGQEDLGAKIKDQEPATQNYQRINIPAKSTIEAQDSAHDTSATSSRSSILDFRPSTLFRTVATLGVQAAEALDHAHQMGVIHRDIKPANLMIEVEPGASATGVRLWVTDYGLAHCQSQGGITMTGDLIGTLRYMSPEQALAKRVIVDHRTDIYSLGATLYELLTLRPPYEGNDRQELLQQIAFDEPRSLRRFNPRIPDELETIVLKALEKSPADRYATAQELADDLRRYLLNEPIRAKRAGLLQKTRKWGQRHPSVVWAAAIFLVMAAVISSMSLVIVDQQRRKTAIALTAETAAKEKAEAREAETMAVLEFVESHVFAAARPEGKEGGQGSEVSLRKAVKSALPFVANSFMDQPLIEARLRLSLGMSFYYLGDAKTAAEQFEAARAIRAKLLGSDHLDTLQCISSLANSYYALGRHAEALQLREETLALQKTKLGPDHHHTLMSMGNLAVSYSAFGRHADALKLHVETLELMKAKLGPEHDDTLGSMHNVAMSYAALGRHADAIKLQEQTLAVQKVKLGLNHYDTLLNMNNLANSYGAVGRHADALKLHEETLALMKRNLGGDHPATLVSMDNLADSYTALGRHADALKLCTDMLELQKVKLGLDHPDTLMSMWSLAEKLVRLDRGAEAVPVIDECVQRTRGQVVDTSLLPGVMDLRLRHFEKTKDAARCRQTAEMLEKLNGADAGSLYAAACFRAVTAAVLKLTPGANATRLANEQADRAMAWLKQAVAAGYKDTDHMKQDTDLDALRGREDFKKLLAELEAGTKK